MPLAETLRQLVRECCQQHNDVSDRTIDLAAGDAAPLFDGASGPLDSIALVGLIVAIEGAVEEGLGRRVFLVDARAASRTDSPFATFGALVRYVAERAEGDGDGA